VDKAETSFDYRSKDVVCNFNNGYGISLNSPGELDSCSVSQKEANPMPISRTQTWGTRAAPLCAQGQAATFDEGSLGEPNVIGPPQNSFASEHFVVLSPSQHTPEPSNSRDG
jgi:hypothetical protein